MEFLAGHKPEGEALRTGSGTTRYDRTDFEGHGVSLAMRRTELGIGMQSRPKSTASGRSSVTQYVFAIKGQPPTMARSLARSRTVEALSLGSDPL